MDDLSQAKKILDDVCTEIQYFKASNWEQESTSPSSYSRRLEELYIRRIKAELAIKKLEILGQR